jgi:hypothetical protein
MSDEDLYEAVVAELEQRGPRKGLWALCFAEADGNETVAEARYLRLRVAELKADSDRTASIARANAIFEAQAQSSALAAAEDARRAVEQLAGQLRPIVRTMRKLGLPADEIARELQGRGLPEVVAQQLANQQNDHQSDA